jgi:hypothetical protein
VSRDGNTYVVFDTTRCSLGIAEQVARFFGGHVVSVGDAGEQSFLQDYLNQSPSVPGCNHLYLGMTDDHHLGQYTWMDGTPINYAHWAANFPVCLNPSATHAVTWAARVCWDRTEGFWYNVEEGDHWDSEGWPFAHLYPMRLPGQWTLGTLNEAVTNGQLLAYVREHYPPEYRYNAFLNKYWDPNINHWMRISGEPNYPSAYCDMRDNYWGTASRTLIDHMIWDYYDDFTSARVEYGTPPEHGFATTYPFVEQVLLNGVSAETVPELSRGRVDFTVRFNRDMDTNVEPFVTFGPAPPHTDFTVVARDENFVVQTNGWLDGQTWRGSAWVTPVTGDGYHCLRISGAVAADDAWLVSGYDVGRYRFEVRTMGIAAMTLQAVGREGGIYLSWQQNDYELLAGYNVYRADAVDGDYVRLNSTVIPPGIASWLDTNVPPAVAKYYRFTVLTTDMTESEYSNVASAMAVDTIAPVLVHAPVVTAVPGRGVRISVTATDNVRVLSVRLGYRALSGTNAYTEVAMVNTSGETWSGTIPGTEVGPPGVAYYVVASDGVSQAWSGSATVPHMVAVNNEPTLTSVTPNYGPAEGGSRVTLAGTQFETGASVLFGGVLASNILVLGPNQITCMTPSHFPAWVDVTVVNSNGESSILLNGFRFETTNAMVSLPHTNGEYGSQIELPLDAFNVIGLRAADVVVRFDPTVISALDAGVGTLTAGWTLAENINTPGEVRLSLACLSTVTGSGTLAVLWFHVIKSPPASTAVVIESISLNDGAIAVLRTDGRVDVSGRFTLSGTVEYFNGARPVQGTALRLVGAGAFATASDDNGHFIVTNLPTGSYVLSASKTNDVTGITAYDASLVLQAASGLLSLSPNQGLAADVNRNAMVTGMDASYILEHAVGLLEVPFPNAGKVWDFVPAARTYGLLNSDLAGQDFSAILIGDVSGNWTPESGFRSPAFGPPLGSAMASPDESVLLAVDDGVVKTNRNEVRILFKAGPPGLYSVDLVLVFDPATAAVQMIQKGLAAQPLLFAGNTNQPGVIRAALAGARPLEGEGDLLVLKLDPVGSNNLRILQASVNEGAIPVRIESTAQAFDSDQDGLLDMDESSIYHTDPARADSDGDGSDDGLELRAGTNPLDATSVFRVESIIVSRDRSVTLVWASVSGRKYQVQCMDCLEPGHWISLEPVIQASGSSANFTDPGSRVLASRFYRVKVVEE